MFHAQGLFFLSALVTGFVDGPADDARLGVAKNLNAAPLRPETPRVVKGTDQLADLASVTESRLARNSSHFEISLLSVDSQEDPSIPLGQHRPLFPLLIQLAIRVNGIEPLAHPQFFLDMYM